MQKKIEEYIKKWNMLESGDHVVVGVSGGADSICLLFVLCRLQEKLGFAMTAVHVNHGIRGEAASADEQFVRRLCEEQQIPCRCYAVDVRKLSKTRRLSEEEAGRIARREAFEETMNQCGGNKIALAHHQNDNAETFLLHAARGSKLRGLGGICPVKGRYIRPLLCVTRKEIECFLENEGIHYCIDATNESEIYMRNKIRNRVLPYLEEQVNAQTVPHICHAMEQLQQVQEFLDKKTQEAYTICVNGPKDGKIEISKERLACQEELLQSAVLYRALCEAAGRERDLEEIHVEKLKELFAKQVGREISLPYQLCASRTYEGITIHKKEADHREESEEKSVMRLSFGQAGSLSFQGKKISWRIFPFTGAAGEIPKKAYTKWFDYGIIKNNAVLRTRRPGDWIVIDEEGKRQKLKAFFINEKIPSEKRSEILLLAQDEQLLWIIGYRQSKACQVTEHTKMILEIKINGGEQDGRDN